MSSLNQFKFLILVIFCCSCRPMADSWTRDFIPAQEQLANMFTGYNSHTRSFGETCVQGDDHGFAFSEIGTDGEVQLKDNVSVEGLVALMNGAGSLKAEVAEGALSGEADYAIRAAQTQYNRSFSIYATLHQDISVQEGQLRLTPTGALYADPSSVFRSDVESVCGNEFVSEITRGIVLLATVKINFFSREDAAQLAGKIKANMPVHGLSLGIKHEQHDIKSRTKIEVIATQIGGDPQNLFEILPDEPAVCDAEDTGPCDALIKNLYDYFTAFTQKSSQDPTTFTPMTYKTEGYGDFIVTKPLTSNQAAPLSDINIKVLEERLRSKIVDAYLMLARLNYILSEEIAKDPTQIKSAKERLRAGIDALKGVVENCQKQEGNCDSKVKAVFEDFAAGGKFEVDRKLLWNE